MTRREAESIAFTIWETLTHGADGFADYADTIADDVERLGHLGALKEWREAQTW